MIGERTKEDLEHSQDIDLMAGGLGAILSENEQTAKAGVAIYVQHPAMDVPGTAKVIDRANRVQTLPKGKFPERLKVMEDRQSTRLNSSHSYASPLPSSALN